MDQFIRVGKRPPDRFPRQIYVVRANRPVPYYNVYRDLQRQFELPGP
jgi:hypothetical protein